MIISHIIRVVTSRLAKNLTLVSAGNMFAAGLGFIAVLLISRQLAVSEFGLFIMVISLMHIASRLSNLGMNTGMIRFVSSYLGQNKIPEAYHVLKLTLFIRLIVGSILTAIVFVTAHLISTKVFHSSDLTILLQIAAFGIIFTSMSNYFKFALYAYQSFGRSVILQFIADISKFVAVVILIFLFGNINIIFAVAIFALTPAFGVLFGYGQFHQKLFTRSEPIKNLFSQLISFSKWSFVSNVCGLIFPHVGIFILAKYLSIESAGIYGLALSLNRFFPIFIGSLRGVLLPEVSRYREIDQFKNYIKGSLRISLLMGTIVIPFMLFSHEIILFFFGSRYEGSVTVFNWLLAGYIIHTINTTIRMALYSMDKPHVIAIVDLFKLVVMVFGSYFLIPMLGMLAPAILVLVINLITLAFLSIYIFEHMKKGKSDFLEN